jgi:hypothetical protein
MVFHVHMFFCLELYVAEMLRHCPSHKVADEEKYKHEAVRSNNGIYFSPRFFIAEGQTYIQTEIGLKRHHLHE